MEYFIETIPLPMDYQWITAYFFAIVFAALRLSGCSLTKRFNPVIGQYQFPPRIKLP